MEEIMKGVSMLACCISGQINLNLRRHTHQASSILSHFSFLINGDSISCE
jgi:hypothetical protein